MSVLKNPMVTNKDCHGVMSFARGHVVPLRRKMDRIHCVLDSKTNSYWIGC